MNRDDSEVFRCASCQGPISHLELVPGQEEGLPAAGEWVLCGMCFEMSIVVSVELRILRRATERDWNCLDPDPDVRAFFERMALIAKRDPIRFMDTPIVPRLSEGGRTELRQLPAELEARPLRNELQATATKAPTMIAYGAWCTWWDSKANVGIIVTDGHRLPCCPHCRQMLFEMDQEQWVDKLDQFDREHKGYREFVAWLRGRPCRRYYAPLLQQFVQESGIPVAWDPSGVDQATAEYLARHRR